MLESLELYNFRNLSQISLDFSKNINLITGFNGSGKSSILESIYYLARGRSFRSANSSVMINDEQQGFIIRAILENDTILASERYRNGQVNHKLNGNVCNTMLSLSEHLPLLFLDTDSQRWLAAGPKNRRKTIDWGLFYGRNAEFYEVWKGFQRGLLQRNAAIKSGMEFWAWDPSFVKYSQMLNQLREEYVQNLQEVFLEIWCDCNLGQDWGEIELAYHPGWSNDLLQSLDASRERDRHLGHTNVGPHRSDLSIRVGGKLAQTHLSQGQQKLLTYAITAAQAHLYQIDTARSCLLLLDDLCAELDLEKRAAIVNFLVEGEHQIIITGVVADEISGILPEGCHHILMS